MFFKSTIKKQKQFLKRVLFFLAPYKNYFKLQILESLAFCTKIIFVKMLFYN